MGHHGVAFAYAAGAALAVALLHVPAGGTDLGGADLRPATASAELVQDPRLDLADANVEKAIALLKAAQNPVAKNPARPFGGHRTKAIALLERAREEIAAAKAFAAQSAQE